MRRSALLLGVVAAVALASGCVQRRFVIHSDPPGALVLRNGQPLSAAPADDSFVYYGKYRFTLVKDGFETLHVDQEVSPPWWQYPPIDFVVENLIPWTFRDIRRFNYTLQPATQPRSDEVLGRGTDLRSRGQAIQSPPKEP
jgi:hypothetical protein